VAHWMNGFYKLKGEDAVDKSHPAVIGIKARVDEMYELGRNTVMGDEELEELLIEVDPQLYHRIVALNKRQS